MLAATNHPWDVDSALRRPGRFDRTLLVLPPDQPAREAILRYHLRERPVAGIDLKALAKRTRRLLRRGPRPHLRDGRRARAARLGVQRQGPDDRAWRDLVAALAEVKPSIGPWLDTARNVAEFANDDGAYDDLRKYLKQERLL